MNQPAIETQPKQQVSGRKSFALIVVSSVLLTIAFLFIIGISSTLIYSIILKTQGDKEFTNHQYNPAYAKYLEAKTWWFPSKLNSKLEDRDLIEKIKRTRLMIHYEVNYEYGVRAYKEKRYDQVRGYLSKVAPEYRFYPEAQNILKIIPKYEQEIAAQKRLGKERTSQIMEANKKYEKTILEQSSEDYAYDDYYPIILSISDDRGNISRQSQSNGYNGNQAYFSPNNKIKPGDIVKWKIVANDPKNRQILYSFFSASKSFTDAFGFKNGNFSTNNEIQYTFTNDDLSVGELFRFGVMIKVEKDMYRNGSVDDEAYLDYELRPE